MMRRQRIHLVRGVAEFLPFKPILGALIRVAGRIPRHADAMVFVWRPKSER